MTSPQPLDEGSAPLLVVDDDPGQRSLLESFLTSRGFKVQTAARGEEALAGLESQPVAMVISDVRMPGMTGLEMLKRIRERHPLLPVLLVTAYADIRGAVEAMRDGAVNYLEKPIDLEELASSVRHALRLTESGAAAAPPPPAIMKDLIAESAVMRDVIREAVAVAPANSRVLITGESGAGKQTIAALIHRLSPRAAAPLVKLNCAGIPEAELESQLFGVEPGAFDDTTVPDDGHLEQADGGSLVLVEAGEIPAAPQAKLARFLVEGAYRRVGGAQDRRADARILITTKMDLEAQTRAGLFREDLYYRLSVFGIHLPPLAERRDDILPLANLFVERFGGRPRFSSAAMICIEGYLWPGNITELRNAMERAALMAGGGVILPEHLPRRVREAAEAPQGASAPNQAAATEQPGAMREIERSVILQTLRENKFNRSETARRLGISRRALIYKLSRFREQGFSIEPNE